VTGMNIRERMDSGWEAALRQLSPRGRDELDTIKKSLFAGEQGTPVPDSEDDLLVYKSGPFELFYTVDEKKDGSFIFYFKSFSDCERLYQIHREVFISYAHKDSVWFERINGLLQRLAIAGDVQFWTDQRIQGGDRWHDVIMQKLEAATAAILLVTRHFMESTFIQEEELPVFLDKAEQDARRFKAERLAEAKCYLGFMLGWIPAGALDAAAIEANDRTRDCFKRIQENQALCNPAEPLDAAVDVGVRLELLGAQVQRFMQRAFQTES
jgi:hypothetical protein